jgi:hypothetical protein
MYSDQQKMLSVFSGGAGFFAAGVGSGSPAAVGDAGFPQPASASAASEAARTMWDFMWFSFW